MHINFHNKRTKMKIKKKEEKKSGDRNDKLITPVKQVEIKQIPVYKYYYPYKSYYIFDDVYILDDYLFNFKQATFGRMKSINLLKTAHTVEFNQNIKCLYVHLQDFSSIDNMDWLYFCCDLRLKQKYRKYVVDKLKSYGDATYYHLSREFEKEGELFLMRKKFDIFEYIYDTALNYVQPNLPYELLSEENFIDQSEMACYFCYDQRIDKRMVLSKLIFTKPLLDALEINPFTYGLYVLKFGLKEIYFEEESLTYANFIINMLKRLTQAVKPGFDPEKNKMSIILRTFTGKIGTLYQLIEYDEAIRFFRFKKCLYFKFSYSFPNFQRNLNELSLIEKSSNTIENTKNDMHLDIQKKFIDKFYETKQATLPDKICKIKFL